MAFPFIPIIGAVWAGVQAFQGLLHPAPQQGQPQPSPQPQEQNKTLLYVILVAIGLIFAWILFFRRK